MPLSTFSAMVDFFNVFDDEGIILFKDIMFEDVGGVGLGEESVSVRKLSYFVESLTPLTYLALRWVSTAISWDPYIT